MDKRQQLVACAFELFYCHGIHAVGINQVLQEAGVAKKTLYHHFSSKEALIEAVVTYRHHRFQEWLMSRIQVSGVGLLAIRGVFQALDDWFNERDPSMRPFHGCFFINASGEYANPEHPVHQLCADHKQSIKQLFADTLSQMGATAEQVREGAETLALLKEGAIVKAHVYGDLNAGRQAGQLATIYLTQLGLKA